MRIFFVVRASVVATGKGQSSSFEQWRNIILGPPPSQSESSKTNQAKRKWKLNREISWNKKYVKQKLYFSASPSNLPPTSLLNSYIRNVLICFFDTELLEIRNATCSHHTNDEVQVSLANLDWILFSFYF
jgi:hypothetical protein